MREKWVLGFPSCRGTGFVRPQSTNSRRMRLDGHDRSDRRERPSWATMFSRPRPTTWPSARGMLRMEKKAWADVSGHFYEMNITYLYFFSVQESFKV
jgi:hypothetical protein